MVTMGRLDLADMLVDYGADPEATDNQGRTPADRAQTGTEEVAERLRERAAMRTATEREVRRAARDVPPEPPAEPAHIGAIPDAVHPDEPYLGWPEDREKKTGPDGLTGFPKMTHVELTTYGTYLKDKQREKVENEERRDGFLYYSYPRHLCVPAGRPGEPSAMITVTQRRKAPLPAD
jgi:hypothetical protein